MSALKQVAIAAKAASGVLQSLPGSTRTAILDRMRRRLLAPQTVEKVLRANEKDLEEAKQHNLERALLSRLKLSEAKLKTLADGMATLAATLGTSSWWLRMPFSNPNVVYGMWHS